MGKRALVVLFVSAGIAAGTPATGIAGPGGSTTTACSAPTLSGPGSASIGAAYAIAGCGFAPRSMVNLEVTEAGGCCRVQQIYIDGTGRFTFTSEAWGPGLYRLRASVQRRKSWVVAAEWSFQAA